MRMFRVLTLIGAAATPLAAQSNFEGVIEFKGFGHDSTTMTQTTKGSMMRLDVDNGGKKKREGYVIFDGKTRMMTMVMMDQKMYMTTSMASMDSMAAGYREGHKPKNVSFKDTGESQVVAGTKCEIYRGTTTNEDGKVEEGQACLAKGVGFAMFQSMGKRGSQDPTTELFKELADKDLHLLKAWRMKDGKMEVAIEATRIERKSIPDSEFQPPAGFKKFEIPSMPGAKPPKP